MTVASSGNPLLVLGWRQGGPGAGGRKEREGGQAGHRGGGLDVRSAVAILAGEDDAALFCALEWLNGVDTAQVSRAVVSASHGENGRSKFAFIHI